MFSAFTHEKILKKIHVKSNKKVASKSPTPPQYVFWQRNDRMINYDETRSDITIETTPGPRTQSRLIIREPQTTDSGNYTCSASNTEPASIYVFVSKGTSPFYIIVIGVTIFLLFNRHNSMGYYCNGTIPIFQVHAICEFYRFLLSSSSSAQVLPALEIFAGDLYGHYVPLYRVLELEAYAFAIDAKQRADRD
uniref:CSON003464 protein n=1 Tax=Culicoides sonorensis TaxID=179676 RepID=A0A336MLG1_CULSO